MAERPDLEYWVPLLGEAFRGRTIVAFRLPKSVVLRVAVEGAPEALLVGRRLSAVRRRGHAVVFELGRARARDRDRALDLVVVPMLAGRFEIAPAGARGLADLALALALDDGRELRFRDDVQMGKVYVIPRGAFALVPGLATVGASTRSTRAPSRARPFASSRGGAATRRRSSSWARRRSTPSGTPTPTRRSSKRAFTRRRASARSRRPTSTASTMRSSRRSPGRARRSRGAARRSKRSSATFSRCATATASPARAAGRRSAAPASTGTMPSSAPPASPRPRRGGLGLDWRALDPRRDSG